MAHNMTRTRSLRAESDPFSPDSPVLRPSSESTTKDFLRGPLWTTQIMILQRFSSWSFVALRGSKRFSPRPCVDSPNYDLAKVFFVVLRGPSWTQKGFLRGPVWTAQIMVLQRFSSWPFVDPKRFSPRPCVDSPNYDLAKVFFVALRGQKRFSPRPFVDSPNYDLAKVFFVVLRGPSWIKKVFSAALRG